jgi:predicted methyltransferase
MKMKNLVSLLGLAALVLSSACQSPDAPTAAATQETTVKPGVNAEYLKPDLNVSTWVERFESEGREIYDHRQGIVAAAKIRSGSVVADIGAGTGLFTPLFSKAVGPKGKVYAVDIVPAFVERIRALAKTNELRNVEAVLCTERSVELPADSIDLAFICDVYHHFEYPRSSLESIHRALRPGGEIFLIEFKRIPGVSSEWTMKHVRAGEEVFTEEIEAAGFKKVEEIDLLKDNYVLRFRKLRH